MADNATPPVAAGLHVKEIGPTGLLEPTVAENVIVTEPVDHVTFGVLELDGAETEVPYEAASTEANAIATTMCGA